MRGEEIKCSNKIPGGGTYVIVTGRLFPGPVGRGLGRRAPPAWGGGGGAPTLSLGIDCETDPESGGGD